MIEMAPFESSGLGPLEIIETYAYHGLMPWMGLRLRNG
jgi:hypothetical protein